MTPRIQFLATVFFGLLSIMAIGQSRPDLKHSKSNGIIHIEQSRSGSGILPAPTAVTNNRIFELQITSGAHENEQIEAEIATLDGGYAYVGNISNPSGGGKARGFFTKINPSGAEQWTLIFDASNGYSFVVHDLVQLKQSTGEYLVVGTLYDGADMYVVPMRFNIQGLQTSGALLYGETPFSNIQRTANVVETSSGGIFVSTYKQGGMMIYDISNGTTIGTGDCKFIPTEQNVKSLRPTRNSGIAAIGNNEITILASNMSVLFQAQIPDMNIKDCVFDTNNLYLAGSIGQKCGLASFALTFGKPTSVSWSKIVSFASNELNSSFMGIDLLPDGNLGVFGKSYNLATSSFRPTFIKVNATSGASMWATHSTLKILNDQRVVPFLKNENGNYAAIFTSNWTTTGGTTDNCLVEITPTGSLNNCYSATANPTITNGSVTYTANTATSINTNGGNATISGTTPAYGFMFTNNIYELTLCSGTTPGPVANFKASRTSVTKEQTVRFTDLTTNSPTNWSWSSTPLLLWSTSTSQHPNATIPSNASGCYAVTLTASNTNGTDPETKTCYLNVVQNPVSLYDTLDNFGIGLNPSTLLTGVSGYVTGTNGFNDRAKAERFVNPITTRKLYGALFRFGKGKNSTSPSVEMDAWNVNAGSPGTVAGSVSVPLATILGHISGNQYTKITFPSPVDVSSTFFVGFKVPAGPDTLAIRSSLLGPANSGTAWEQWQDLTWHEMSATNSWDADISLMVFPIMINTITGVEEIMGGPEVVLFPNPATDQIRLMEREAGSTVRVQVFSLQGTLIKELDTASGPISFINLNGLAKGLYMIGLTNREGKTKWEKVVKE